jgi:predicted nucleotidyltransferase
MLSKEQQNIIIETLKPFDPTYIGLFGSYARNEEKDESDIDLLVEFDNPKLNLFDIGGIYSILEEKLHRKVDLAFKKYLKQSLKPHILKDTIVLYEA